MSGAEWPPLLPSEWRDAAASAAANLGLGLDLTKLSAEHWQKVLATIETRVRLEGAAPPAHWRERLARQVGRPEALSEAAPAAQSASVRVLEEGMADLESLVARYVREAHTIASAVGTAPAPEPITRALEWVQAVKEQADAIPAGQGPARLARIAGRLRDLAASTATQDGPRQHTLQQLAAQLGDPAP